MRQSILNSPTLASLFGVLMFCSIASGQALNDLPSSGGTWIFMGDSNTYAGGYVARFEAAMNQHYGSEAPRIINLGVSSETASGLSEPDHPFPRPCIHSRIDKTLRMLKPSVVFVCYGMNDGIYAPPTEAIMRDYKASMQSLVEKINNSGATVILLTPPPFESSALRQKNKKFGPTAKGNYAWFAPSERYDEVVEEMSRWLLAGDLKADHVIDIRSMLLDLQTSSNEPLTNDGVHFQASAHRALADHLCGQFGLAVVDDSAAEQAAMRRMTVLRDAWLSATGKNRPGLPAGLPPVLAEQKAAATSTHTQEQQ